MIELNEVEGVYLYNERVDFRKSINGLVAIIQSEMKLNIFNKNLFVFRSKDRTRLKILYWDKTGFALWLKRLERDKFPWPKSDLRSEIKVSTQELRWLVSGVEYYKVKPHETVFYEVA